MDVSLPDPWERPLLTVPEAARALGIPKRTAYQAVRDLELPTVEMGGWLRVSTRYVYEALGEPLPPRPGQPPPQVFTLED